MESVICHKSRSGTSAGCEKKADESNYGKVAKVIKELSINKAPEGTVLENRS
jgi:hypothetical protein